MKDLPYFRWWVARADTDETYSSMTDQELGFYHRCLNKAWVNTGLPADLDKLSRLMKVTREYLDSVWGEVGKCWLQDGDRLFNRTQEEERSWALSKSAKATSSVRSRYERSFDRSTDDLLRARARADSVCVSDSSSDSKKQTQEEAKSGDYPTPDARRTPAGRPPGSQNDISGAEIDISGAGMPISGAHRRAADLSGSESSRWEEFWQAYPRKQRKDAACQQFLSVVTIASEGRVFRCLERYLSSDEVARGVVANPDKWLYEQHRNEWEGDWPKRPELQAAIPKKHIKIDESRIVPYDPFELGKKESA